MPRPTTRRSSARISTALNQGHPGNAEALVQHFNGLGIPEAEVNFDVDLFMQKYFVNAANGRPDRAKSSEETICLAGSGLLPQQETKLREAASRVKGLILREATEGQYRALFLGWSDSVVGARIMLWKSQKQQGVERQGEAQEAESPQTGEADENIKHTAYMQLLAAEGLPRESSSIIGSYVIRCPSIEDQWDDDDDDGEEMALDVKKTTRDGVYEAGFRFRVLEGVMLLSTDKKLLVKHRNDVDRTRSRENAWDWNYLRDENSGEDDGSETATSSSKKRKRSSVAATDTPNPRRFWLMWNGRETGEGHLQADYDMNHTGCIEFADDTFTTFRAEMNLEFVGGDDLFRGFKVADTPSRKRNTAWKKFHAATYKYITI